MGLMLGEALKSLCVEIGWSYAVFWRAVGAQNPTHLVWEDGYCERVPPISGVEAMDLLLKEQGLIRNHNNDHASELRGQAEDRVGMLVNKIMAAQVHVVGAGMVGQAALTGNHQWIIQDILHDYGSIAEGFAEINHQFLAGIQTIAVIPVIPHGVVQLGAIQMIIENTVFVNHVRSLFAQLAHVPGALFSDITQKTLSQRSQVHSSLGMQISYRQSTDICTKSSENFPQMASEVTSTKQTITNKGMLLTGQFQPNIYPGVKSILHANSQLENRSAGAQIILSKPDENFIQQLPSVPSVEGQNQPLVMASGASFSSLRFPEEQLLLMSTVRSADNTESALYNGKIDQLKSSKCYLPNSLKDPDIAHLFGTSGSLENANDLGNFGSLPDGTTESIRVSCANSSVNGVAQVSNQRNRSNSSRGISGNSQQNQLSAMKNSLTVLTTEKQKVENNLFQASHAPPSESDANGLCHNLLVGSLPAHRVSNSNCAQEDQRSCNVACGANVTCVAHGQNLKNFEASELPHMLNEKTSFLTVEPMSGNDLFDMLGLEDKTDYACGSLDDVLLQSDDLNACKLDADISSLSTQLDVCPTFDSLNDEIFCSRVFSMADSDQLLDAVISKFNSGAKQSSDDNMSCKTSITNIHSSHHGDSPDIGWVDLSEQVQGENFGHAPMLVKPEKAASSYIKPACSLDKTEECSQRVGFHKSQIRLWVESSQNVKSDSLSASNGTKVEEIGKLNRKRPRPGESPRPRPKDRQMIQDRIKELREIVPNGAKCSIDALLERTIKHMLFLQSVSKHVDKLKEIGEPKIISKEGGPLLEDNFDGGATWAFEVGSQSMICPIMVEDLNPPRQMLVEMLCEERGFFLEIADFIRGLGLTILKGVMEARKNKVWARFAVEANRDVTRMEIFLSLVRMLEPTAGSSIAPQNVDDVNMPHTMLHQPTIPVTGLSDRRL
ncbi:transcription factor LHW-like isoform X2 [Phoenix dactylifera]|uniref:Transcription factor LHW-like isoform X2 n=1 Tax=Phoenix dactylifera TaxID=42345 RepID=A0A8B7BRY2_PHODC|nr:transcription factor LHW-like isoform X2 [Phoenix dactylifera]